MATPIRWLAALVPVALSPAVAHAAEPGEPEHPPDTVEPPPSPPTSSGPQDAPSHNTTSPSSPAATAPTDAVDQNEAGATAKPRGRSIEELDLVELLNMKVTVSSKDAAPVSRSPGMVTVYGEGDIRRLGYYTLSDLADITAGYSSYTIYGEKVFETRGQKAGSFNNNKHLVLVDGIPVNHGKGNKAMTEENYPLFFAQRVEFLKGPASALYGTSAFFGVVNIAPKELEGPGYRAEGRAGMGTEQVDKRALANVLYRDNDRHAALYAGFYEKGPSKAYTGTTSNPDNRFWDDQRSEFLYMTYGVDSGPLAGMKAGFIYSSKNGGLGEHWLGGYSPEWDDLTWVQMIPYVKYERRLATSLSFDGYFKASRDIEKGVTADSRPISTGTGTLLSLYENRISVYEGLAEVRWTPVENAAIIGGVDVNVNYQNRGDSDYDGVVNAAPGPVFTTNPRTLGSGDLFQTYSTFLQAIDTLPVLCGLHLTAGTRLDTGKALDHAFSQLSPRAGLVQELTDFLSLKLLYGTALRAPGNKEIGLNNEARPELADPSEAAALKPETIRSLEGGVSFNASHVSVNVAAFMNDTRSALDGRPAAGLDGNPRNIFVNAPGKIVARGTEVEVAVAADADSRVFANWAYSRALLHAGQGMPDVELSDVPIHKVNAGASYRLRSPFDLTGGVVGRWVSGYRSGLEPVQPPSGFEPSGHFVLDANFISRLTEHLSLELLVRNVLDAKYMLPKNGIMDVPMPRRSFHLTLDYRW